MRIGVVAIHGIAPHPRYEIQDEFAEALETRLNEVQGAGTWELSSDFLPFTKPNDPESVRVTLNRVASSNHAIDHAIDVIEAYWSPIDKGRTNVLSVAGWALKTIFMPLNNAAKFPGAPWKALFDITYLMVAMLIVLGAVAGVFYWGGISFQAVAQKLGIENISFFDVVTNPWLLFQHVWIWDATLLAASAAGAVCVAQVASAILGGALVRRRPRGSRSVRPRAWAVALRIAFVFVVGATLLWVAATRPLHSGQTLGSTVWWLTIAVGLLELASSTGREFLINRIGDVQIYTIGDENSQYFTYREQIRTVAEAILLETILRRDAAGAPYYESIVIAGHSLGSTIGIDALMRVHEIHEATLQNPGPPGSGVSDDDWNRVRAFITFGTAVEKTKFFFSALRPSFSAWREQWNSRLYGHLFTPKVEVLRGSNDKQTSSELGIYWLNLTYWTDCIANRIESYRSRIEPRGWDERPKGPKDCPFVAEDHLLQNPWSVFPHSNYLGDVNFWIRGKQSGTRALDVFFELMSPPEPATDLHGEEPAPASP